MLCPICSQENEAPDGPCCRCGAPLGETAVFDSAEVLPIGSALLNGNFEVTRVIGRGGFGIVYEGRDLQLQRRVAIKEFLAPTGGTGDSGNADRQSFLNEARLLARFRHPNIIDIFSVFEDNDRAYLVTEFLQGRSLQEVVAQNGPLDTKAAMEAVAPVCDALKAMHAADVLHRDIKPENVIRCLDGRIVLIDFGIARPAEGPGADNPVVLTPGYAPLEQYSAKTKLSVGADIYALGATLYFLLTGKVPLDAAARGHGADLTPPNVLEPGVGAQINKCILWAMEMRVENRPASVELWYEALLAPPPPLIAPPSPLPGGPARQPAVQGSREPVQILAGHDSYVTRLIYSADGHYVATSGKDGILNVWETENWTRLWKLRFQNPIVELACTPDNLLLGGGPESSVLFWNFADGQAVQGLELPRLTRFLGSYSSTQWLALASDGKTLYTATGLEMLVWNIVEKRLIREVKRPVDLLSISPQGNLLACCVATGPRGTQIELWNAENDQILFTLATRVLNPAALSFSPDNRHLAFAVRDGAILNWDLHDKQQSREWNGGQHVECLAYSPDGQILASAGERGIVNLWRATEPGLLASFPAHNDYINDIAFSPDSKFLATASGDTTVKVWSMA